MKQKLLVSLWSILACEIIVGLFLYLKISELRAKAVGLNETEAQVQQVTAAITRADKQIQELESAVPEPPPPVHGRFSFRRLDPKPAQLDKIKRLIAESPESLTSKSLDVRGEARVRYGLLISKLQLDPSQSEKLLDLLVDKMMVNSDINKSVQTQISKLSVNEILALEENIVPGARNEVETNIKMFLGNEKFEQYREYNSQIQQNLLAGQVQQTLVREQSSDTLSARQIDELIRIFVENPPVNNQSSVALTPLPSGSPPAITAGNFNLRALGPDDAVIDSSGYIHSNYVITDSAYKAAQLNLQPAQLTVLRKIRTQQLAERTIATEFHFNASR